MGYEDTRKKRLERTSKNGSRVERAPEPPKEREPIRRVTSERFDGSRSRLEARIGVTRVPESERKNIVRREPIRINPKEKTRRKFVPKAKAGGSTHGGSYAKRPRTSNAAPRADAPRDTPRFERPQGRDDSRTSHSDGARASRPFERASGPRAGPSAASDTGYSKPYTKSPTGRLPGRAGAQAGAQSGERFSRPSERVTERTERSERMDRSERTERSEKVREVPRERMLARRPELGERRKPMNDRDRAAIKPKTFAEKRPFDTGFARRTTPRKTKVEPPKPLGAPERVQKLIAASGLASRREAETWISEGRVQVNGKTIKLGDQATRKDHVTVNGAPISFPKPVVIMLNKPKDYVTTRKDIYGNKTVMELVASDERLYPVGRLDKDTTGLLLLTNDGEFANRVMHPRYEIEKTYVATLDKPFEKKDLIRLSNGIRLKEGIVLAKVKPLSSRSVQVTLHQGYNHVVKRIMKELGYYVRELERIKVGDVSINIPLGAYRPLTEKEIEMLVPRAKPKDQASANASS